jgi:hypothetical protein
MADKKDNKDEDIDKKFLIEIILAVVAIFIIWLVSGMYKEEEENKPFVVPYTDPVHGGKVFGTENLILSPDNSSQTDTTSN